jgi:hypothetical protein
MKNAAVAAALALTLGLPAAAHAQDKPVACVFNQFSSAERVEFGRIEAADIASGDSPSAPDKQRLEKTVFSRIRQCPTFSSMKDAQSVAVAQYAESRLLYEHADRLLGATRQGYSMIDAVWNQAPADDLKVLFDVGKAAKGEDADFSGATNAAKAISRTISQFSLLHHLTEDETHLLGMGVSAKLGMAMAEQDW